MPAEIHQSHFGVKRIAPVFPYFDTVNGGLAELDN
jgi:hypothetical protein